VTFYAAFYASGGRGVPKRAYSSAFLGQSVSGVTFMDQKREQPKPGKIERPIPPKIYPVLDTDLARDNVENDLPAADLQELQ